MSDIEFRKRFFRDVTDKPLDPDDPRYEPLYTDGSLAETDDDPVELMAWSIESTPGESVQLLSGFRGTGKTTELQRLKQRLEGKYLVVSTDLDDYLNHTTKVDVSDFLMILAGAFSDALGAPHLLGSNPARESYWERLTAFLTKTRIEFDGITAKASPSGVGVDLKANLQSDPTFKQELQKQMSGHIGAFVADLRSYLEGCVKLLKQVHGDEREIVFIVDSIEHIRGTSINALEVQASLEELFVGQSDKLRLPNLHVIYTIHPYLKVRAANLGGLYEPGGVRVLPTVKVREVKTGKPFQPGLDALERVVQRRGDWERLLGSRAVLDRLILESGGHLRDLLRIIAEVLRRASSLPVPERTVEAALSSIRNEFLPIADADAIWLARIAETHEASLADVSRLPDLARFLDTHLVLCYWNGREWYDVHPLVRETVIAQAAGLEAEKPRAEKTP